MSLWDKMKGLRNFAKKIKFIYIPYRNIKISIVTKRRNKMLHKSGISIMNDIEQALKDSGLLYFVDFGTLLGVIRDNNFISWDCDIDYGIVNNENFDWDKLEEILSKNNYSKVKQFKIGDEIKEQTYSRDGVLTIDFFLHNDDGVAYSFYKKDDYNYPNENYYHAKEYYFAKINETKTAQFLGIDVSVPSNSEEFLESSYSENWQIPDPSWDITKRTNVTELKELAYSEDF